jgi:hypothetical protein
VAAATLSHLLCGALERRYDIPRRSLDGRARRGQKLAALPTIGVTTTHRSCRDLDGKQSRQEELSERIAGAIPSNDPSPSQVQAREPIAPWHGRDSRRVPASAAQTKNDDGIAN